MILIDVAIGVGLGAAFSPFWISIWNKIKAVFVKDVEAKIESVVTPTSTPTKTL